jgi:erythromycin esterase
MLMLALLAALSASPRPALSIRPDDEAAAIQWFDASAHGFTSESPPTDELSPLVARLAGAEIVGVGEVTHGDHEDQAFKAELIKALVLKGQTQVLVLESNRQVGADLDAYIDGKGGDLPALLRSPSFFRTWRTDEFAGLILWLRAYNVQAEQPVHIVAVDVQDPGADADLALRFVAARDPAAANRLRPAFAGLSPGAGAQRFAPWQASVDKPRYVAAMQASVRLEALFQTHKAQWANSPDYADAAYAARTARQAFDAFELDNKRGDADAAGLAYYGRRDRFMAANALDRLKGRTGVLWAHDMHVIGDIPASDGWPSGYTWMGRELRRSLGDRYMTVDFSWSTGAFRAQTGSADIGADVLKRTALVPQTLPNDLPQDLGGVLEKVKLDRFWVDLRSLPAQPWAVRFSSTPYYRGWPGWAIDPNHWNDGVSDHASLRPGTDILVWFRRITPSHFLPGDDF